VNERRRPRLELVKGLKLEGPLLRGAKPKPATAENTLPFEAHFAGTARNVTLERDEQKCEAVLLIPLSVTRIESHFMILDRFDPKSRDLIKAAGPRADELVRLMID